MKKRKLAFDYSKLRAMDRVDCAGRSPFAMTTRIVTAGRKQAFNYSIPVHTGTVVDFHGRLLVAEMTPQGLRLNSLSRYTTEGGRRWALAFRRHAAYDNADIRDAAQRRIAHDLQRTLDYDFRGLLEFVSSRVKDHKDRNYCSEYHYEITRDDVPYPSNFAVRVSPMDHLAASGWLTVHGAIRYV